MKKQKHIEYDWFGIDPKSKKRKKPQMVSFLGLGTPAKKQKLPSQVNFLGNANPTFSLKSRSTLFLREGIKTKKKRLSKWGDVDMDGSPNYFDCDPKNFLKDAKQPGNAEKRSFLKRVLLEPIEKKRVRSKYDDQGSVAIKEAGRREENLKNRRIETVSAQNKAKDIIEGREAYVEDLKSKGLRADKSYLKETKALKGEFRKGVSAATKEEKKEGKFISKLTGAAQSFKEFSKAAKITGPAGSVAMKGLAIREKLDAGEKVSQKQIQAFERAKEKTTFAARAGRLGEAAGFGTTMAIAGGVKSYSKEMAAKSARVRRATTAAAGLLFGPSLAVKGGFGSEPRGRGRPSGPSGEYKIGGKPVYEEEFQQYKAKQNALNRILPSETQSQTLNPEYLEYQKAQMAQRNQPAKMQSDMDPRRFQQPELQSQEPQYESPNEPMMGSDGAEITEPIPSDQAPQTEGMTNEAVQAIEAARRRPYTRASMDEIKMAQQMAQQKDQILNAPNFMKGELKAAGGGILTPTGPQIMDAPNAFKGEMRNVYKEASDLGEVKLSERPQTNPYGDEYLEIEAGSGRPVVRKRIREKWMTGEAL